MAFEFSYGNDNLLFGDDLGYTLPDSAPSFDTPSDFGSGYSPSTPQDMFTLGPIGGGGFSTPVTTPTPEQPERSWTDSLTNPNVLGAAITAGAGLFGGMSRLNAEKEAQKASQEQQKMNNLLELAKLKYQLTKGGGGSGRGSGGARRPTQAEIDAQYRNSMAGSYNSVGSGIAGAFR